MSLKLIKTQIIYSGLITCLLTSCTHPPYNNFKPRHPVTRGLVAGATMGTAAGAAVSGSVPGALVGTAIGGSLGAIAGSGTNPKRGIVRELKKHDVEFVQYGDTMTLIIPTDKYFMFGSPRLNELQYKGLENIAALLSLYPDNPVYVAGFTDDVGTDSYKRRMSQAQAESMMTFLWANGVKAYRLKTEGYADKNTVADNEFIHGSAMNRRIEIQWFIGRAPKCCISPSKANYAMK